MGTKKLWLWQNGDHFLAFDNPCPCYPGPGDPMTLGDPVAIAIFTDSENGWGAGATAPSWDPNWNVHTRYP